MTPADRINAERFATTLKLLMDQDGQRELAAAAELRSDEITRARPAIKAIAHVLAARGYELLLAREARLLDTDRVARLERLLGQKEDRIAQLEAELGERV